MQQALALLEFSGAAAGILAVDRLLKMSPVALLRCGTVHPGRYLALVGGSVAAVQEAHAVARAVGCELGALLDEVCLADPHAQLAAAVGGARRDCAGEALCVIEVGTSPGLLRALDAVLKAVPVELVEARLADDLGGRALAVLGGRLHDVQEALEMARATRGAAVEWLGGTLLPRLDDTLRDVLNGGTAFGACRTFEPAGAEKVEG
ncbi:MAG: BMC domain-containing protein [bacterium]|nr:BMC domain-containing protein [bacterium]MBK7769395.1 BMC domain-containing protein [bacterium]